MHPEAALIWSILRGVRYNFSNEKELQDGIALSLESSGIPLLREEEIAPGDRIDFLCGHIGIEIKVAGSTSSVTRQLWRYAQHPQIHALILVTPRAKHLDIPVEINGKPIFVACLQTAF